MDGRCKDEQFRLVGRVLLLLLLCFAASPTRAQIVVGDEELLESQIFSVEPLIGFRKSSPHLFQKVGKGEVGIPVDVFVESAKATPGVRETIMSTGKDPAKATFNDWYFASKSTEKASHQASAEVSLKSLKGEEVFDPLLVSSLTETEVFKAGKPSTVVKRVGNKDVEWVKVDQAAAEAFTLSYTKLASTAKLSPAKAHQGFKQANAKISEYPFLAKAVEFNSGQVTFGSPVTYNSMERNLVLPSSLLSQNDVYWIEFAVSYRNVNFDRVKTLSFAVTVPSGIVALELIPLRFEKEVSVTRMLSSPEIKMKFGENAVELGKILEQQVVFKTLLPTIVAEGLQESEFSWTLSDDAVQPGSRRFIAILQVPKGKKTVTFQMQASARTKSDWIAQGDILSTHPKLIEVRLR